MQRWIVAATLAGLMMVFTGCATSRSSCKSCNNCGPSTGGVVGKLKGRAACRGGDCGCNGPLCRPGSLGWQQGGLDYSSTLSPGFLGHGVRHQEQVTQPGPPSATVAYPYYSHRGPRDFLLDNPPSIGR